MLLTKGSRYQHTVTATRTRDVKRWTNVSFKNSPAPGRLTIVIPACFDPQGLRVTASSLNESTEKPLQAEVIVANDGGDPNVRRICEQNGMQCLNIYPRQGSYVARMAALEHATGSIIAFLDAGVIVSSGWLSAVCNAMQRADYVGGPIRVTLPEPAGWAHLWEWTVAFKVKSSIYKARFAPTANLVVSRAVFEDLGGFDRRLKSGGDREFGQRVSQSERFVQAYSADMIVEHPARGFRKMLRKIDRVQAGKVMLTIYCPSRYRSERPGFLKMIGKLMYPTIAFLRGCRSLSARRRAGGLFVAIVFGLRSFTSYVKYVTRSPKSADFERR